MRAYPHHLDIPIKWSTAGFRSVIGEEVAWVSADGSWTNAPRGDRETFTKLLFVTPRAWRWQGPWLLLSDSDTLSWALAQYASDPLLDMVVREAAWFWRSLNWGYYCGPELWGLLTFLTDEVHGAALADELLQMETHPIRDWLRLERAGGYLRSAIQGAERGDESVTWGLGQIDVRPLLKDGEGHHV